MTTPQPNPTDDLEAVAHRPPEVGERFHFFESRRVAGYEPATLVFKDDRGFLYERKDGARQWANASPDHDFVVLAALRPAGVGEAFTVDDLAQEIRRVDGNHSLGAGALAEALTPFLVMKMVAYGQRYATPAHPDAALMERVRTALEPFAREAAEWSDDQPASMTLDQHNVPSVTIGHCREARRLLSDLKAEAGR